MQVGNLAEWFGAVATFLAVVVALIVAFSDSVRTRILEKKSQASLVSVLIIRFGLAMKKDTVYVSNTSKQPIYDVFISYGVAYGSGDPYLRGDENQVAALRVPPGAYFMNVPKYPGRGMHAQLGLSISFRDNNGVYWRRDARGILIETKNDPFIELGIDQPFNKWEVLDPATPIIKS